MRRPNTKSVRFRTALGATAALIALLVVAGVAIDWYVGRQLQQSFDTALMEQAADRALLLDDGARPGSLTTPVGDEEVVVIVGPAGDVVASSGATDADDLVHLASGISDIDLVVQEAGEGPEPERLRAAAFDSASGFRVVVANEAEQVRNARSAVRNMLLTTIPLTAIAAAALAWVVTGRALRPVKIMRRELDDVVRAGDGQRVTQPATADEIDDLAGTINDVLDRLDHQSLAQRQFVANASHELKSPLANARALIETSDISGEEISRLTGAVAGELNRLHGLVDDLLYLARSDEGVRSEPRTIDLADVVFDESERVAAMTSKQIDASGVAPMTVTADPAAVARAIRNLLENAERFAKERVTISTRRSGGAATVVVADDGPGIPESDRAAVFERFSRLDTDRARSAGGTGLGLSIVASIAESNGGTIELTDSLSGGAQFALTFPC